MAAFAIYIVAAVAIGLLIGFVALSIGWLKKTVLRNVRSKTIGLLSVYDDLLSLRSRELADIESRLQEKREELEQLKPEAIVQTGTPTAAAPCADMMSMVERTGAAMYRDDGTSEMYRMIRDRFSFRVEDILPTLSGPEQDRGSAGRLLDQLDFDTIYSLSTLTEEEQLAILREILPEEGRTLVERFLEAHGAFRVLDFYEDLRAQADMEPKPIRLHVPSGTAAEKPAGNSVEIVSDPEICEGFQVEEDNLLYDYCIRSRELS